ncbi:helix-turn-helix domain-containing protein [Paenibacillus tianjinensis]|uniref:Helix-turn-helix transcriptional regulator n=1 Tax=Paenibacillus tianjinensis TaxID=2810347 RepID=A0ABX7LAU6_9BACL|nr:helix-turn-helix transcriptional regulator [Paenibacillus tianjinensis]QSF45282.1 helix-turn-helix transcriptional regulator [Paenibacillus tianjinensis]
MNYIELGLKIRTERNRIGLTQEKLSELVGISESYLGHIERGDRKLSVETLISLASVLNVTIDSLLYEEISEESDIYINQFKYLTNKLAPKQKQIVIDVVKTLTSHLGAEE